MSKRGKDLFYLLEQRERGGRPQPSSGTGRRTSAGSVTAKVRQWLEGGRPARRNAGTAPPLGLIVAAVALAALGAGFALGRFLPRAEPAADLTARREGPAPRRPGPVATEQPPLQPPAAGELPAEKWEEVLSERWFNLLGFSASQRTEAANAATFLRANGVETARIRKFQHEKTRVDLWVVVAYATPGLAPPELLAKLKAVPATRTWGLGSRLSSLNVADLKTSEQPTGSKS